MTVRVFDVVVIGAGPVGENVADRAVQGGLTAAIVEAELVGGECSYWACMPTKALLRPGQALEAARRVPGAREAVGEIDPAAVLAFRDDTAAHWHDTGQVGWLDSAGITLLRGHGRISGPREVTVQAADGSQETIRANHAVAISTGSSPIVPGDLAAVSAWTTRDAISTESIPPRIIVVGGGVVACEFATAFRSLGSQVDLVVRGDRLLAGQEDIAGDLVAQAFADSGVRVHLGRSITAARRGESVEIDLDDGTTLVADEILAATGRRPRLGDVGLDSIGLSTDKAPKTDDTLLVDGTDWLYAVGDVNGRALLTHQGKYQARAAGDAIVARAEGLPLDDGPWGRHVATADHAAVPQVVFTDPQVVAVGLTADAARKQGIDVTVVDHDLGAVAGASVHAEHYRGAARLVVDTARQVVVGATFVGPDATEMGHAATIAVVGEVPIHRLWHAVPSYPTLSEVWLRLLEKLGRDTANGAAT